MIGCVVLISKMRFVVLYCQQRLHIRPLLFIGLVRGTEGVYKTRNVAARTGIRTGTQTETLIPIYRNPYVKEPLHVFIGTLNGTPSHIYSIHIYRNP